MNYFTIAKFALLALVLAFAYRQGGSGCRAEFASYRETQAELAVKQAAKHDKDVQNAEAIHDIELAAIPARVITTPVFVRTHCPVSVPSEAGHQPATSRDAEPGSRDGDIRTAIEDFKAKYETVIADCRRLSNEWPGG